LCGELISCTQQQSCSPEIRGNAAFQRVPANQKHHFLVDAA
jgi:hypothetical protein